MNINFDESSLKEIANKYHTDVVMTDYVRRVEVYKGPLDDSCFNMLRFYLDNGWLNDCTWTKTETPMKSGWTKLVTEALDKSDEEVFNITVKIKASLADIKVIEADKKSNWLLMGLLAGLFPFTTVLEVLGIASVFNLVKKEK